MITWRQIISGSAGPIFTIFTSNKSFLAVDDRSGPLFSTSQGTVAMETDFVQKMENCPLSSLWHLETVWGNDVYVQD